MTRTNEEKRYSVVEIGHDGSVWEIKGATNLTRKEAEQKKIELKGTVSRYSELSLWEE